MSQPEPGGGLFLIVLGIVWRVVADEIRDWEYPGKRFLPEPQRWLLYLFKNVLSPLAVTLGCAILVWTAVRWLLSGLG